MSGKCLTSAELNDIIETLKASAEKHPFLGALILPEGRIIGVWATEPQDPKTLTFMRQLFE